MTVLGNIVKTEEGYILAEFHYLQILEEVVLKRDLGRAKKLAKILGRVERRLWREHGKVLSKIAELQKPSSAKKNQLIEDKMEVFRRETLLVLSRRKGLLPQLLEENPVNWEKVEQVLGEVKEALQGWEILDQELAKEGYDVTDNEWELNLTTAFAEKSWKWDDLTSKDYVILGDDHIFGSRVYLGYYGSGQNYGEFTKDSAAKRHLKLYFIGRKAILRNLIDYPTSVIELEDGKSPAAAFQYGLDSEEFKKGRIEKDEEIPVRLGKIYAVYVIGNGWPDASHYVNIRGMVGDPRWDVALLAFTIVLIDKNEKEYRVY